ncbi:Endocuticle structural glycoprotein SgAbd-1 [Pseudolycoriella hygida]|uniref:Endocuticle structural glycoprotein SgAbd-1 n=1 Tax=Pseudolycoriella hygida TaxID=35572 RepID=A0A9Q0MQB1_9DIPT|nr:Endocuticle structural glycoprotein SgAbd-1 [Pseudolycoriella hygida]
MKLLISLVILLSICWNVRSESTKSKREYFPSDVQYPTSTVAYDNDAYDVYGRTFKKKTDANAAIIKQIEHKQNDGSYHYEFETENGIRQQETSVQNGLERVVRGSYSYVGPDGITYTVNYIADRNGYRAYGAHLPVQPDAVADLVNQQFITTTALSSPTVTSTIIPITNRPFRRRYHATPLFRKNVLSNVTPQPITYSTTPYPIINSTPFIPSPTTIGTTLISPAPGIPFSTSQSPIQNPSLFSPTAQGFQYTPSSTPIPINEFGISSTTPRPFTVTQPSYVTDDTVYITPPPRRQHNLSSQDYLHRELLPPFAVGSAYENNNIGIPNVRPLFPNPSSYNPYRPSGFDSRYPF